MEVIHKIVSLENFKSRFNGQLPILTGVTTPIDECDWGGFPYDIIIPEGDELLEISKQLPLIDNNVLRYKQMVLNYVLIKNLLYNSKFKKLCLRGNDKRWIDIDEYNDNKLEYFVKNTFDVVEYLQTEGYEVGAIILYCDNYDIYMSYMSTFGNMNKLNNKRYDVDFLVMCEGLRSGQLIEDYNYQEPYVRLQVYLDTDIDSLGIFSANEEIWVPNKKYYVGEYTFYDKGDNKGITAFRLVKGDKIETIDITYLYTGRELPLSQKSSYTESFITVIDGRVFLNKPYYCGHYDENTHITYFDDETNSHWEYSLEENSKTKESVTGLTESRLINLKVYKKSLDDEGNILPFIVIDNTTSGETKMIYDFAYRNISKNDTEEYYYCDFIKEIIFTDNDEKTKIVFNKNNASDGVFSSGITFDGGTVKFVYFKGAVLDGDNNIIEDTGVEYTDIYSFKKDEYICNYEGVSGTSFYFINLLLNLNGYANNEDDIINAPLSEILVRGNEINNDYFQKVPFYKDDDLIGLEDTQINGDFYVDRGVSAALERHNILGEVNTLADLENYKNDFFKIR